MSQPPVESIVFYRRSSNRLRYFLTKDGAPVTGANINVKVWVDDSLLPGIIWPVTLTDNGAGVYSITFDETMEIDADEEYKVEANITHDDGHLRTERKMVCLVHRG